MAPTVNPILVIIIIVVSGLTLLGNLYFLVYFQHPDDRLTAWLPKIVVVLGMTFAFLSVLMLPLDVGNSELNGGLQMDFLWMLVYISMVGMVTVAIPFTIFYYESEDVSTDEGKTALGRAANQLTSAICYTFFTLAVFLGWSGIFYATLGVADLPLKDTISGLSADLSTLHCTDAYIPGVGWTACQSKQDHLQLQVSFVVYLIAMLAFFGWFAFCVLTPLGLVALPISLIRSFLTRPRQTELDKYARAKIQVRDKTALLLEKGRKLNKDLKMSPHRSRKQQREFNKFKAEVVLLEDEMDLIRTAYKERNGNPIKYFAYLFVGILAASTSLMWFIHICIYMLPSPPINPFLNNFFKQADAAFGLIGTAAYGCFSLYLIWAAVKGNITLGLRFSFFQVYPMKMGGTLMNSMLFNTGLIIIVSVTTTQFCTMAFQDYTQKTAVNSLFGTQATNMRFIDQFFLQFPKAFLAVYIFWFLYLMVFPSDHPAKKFSAL